MAVKTDSQSESGLSRRDALKVGAAVGGALWATPVVQALTVSPAAAQTTSPQACSGRAFDVMAEIDSTLAGGSVVNVGPVQDTATGDNGCIADAAIAQIEFVATADCVSAGCPATFSAATVAFVIPGAGIPVSATALQASANATCDEGGSTTWSIGSLFINGQGGALTQDPPAIDLGTLFGPLGLTGTIDIVHREETATSASIDLIYVNFRFEDPITGNVTTGTIRVGHAEATATGCE